MHERGYWRCLLLATLLVVTTALRPATAAGRSVAEPPDAGAVGAFWSRLDATWNSGDARRFSELFAMNGSFHFVDREQLLDSRAEILAYFEALFPNVAPEISHQTTVRRVRAVTPELRVVDATVKILRASADEHEPPSVLRNFVVFGVLKQDGANWHIKALSAHELPLAAGDR